MFLLYDCGTFKVYKSHKSDPRSKDIVLASFRLLDVLKDSVFQTLIHTSETLLFDSDDCFVIVWFQELDLRGKYKILQGKTSFQNVMFVYIYLGYNYLGCCSLIYPVLS